MATTVDSNLNNELPQVAWMNRCKLTNIVLHLDAHTVRKKALEFILGNSNDKIPDDSLHQSAFRVDISCGRDREWSTDNRIDSSSRVGNTLDRWCLDRLSSIPNNLVFELKLHRSKAQVLQSTCKLTDDHIKYFEFHSPIAHIICTLDFILGLFSSVTELRLLLRIVGVCFFLKKSLNT